MTLFFLLEHLQARLCQNADVTVRHSHLDILDIRADAERDVRNQGPGSRRPYEKILVAPFYPEADIDAGIPDLLVTERQFMRTQHRFGFRILRNDLVILVDQSFVENRFQGPPDRLDVVVVAGDVGCIHIHPVSHLFGQPSPSLAVVLDMMIDQRLCLGVEFTGSVLLDLGLVFQAQFFFHRNLHRKSVSVPSCLAGNLVPLHGFETTDDILDRAAEDMMHSRLAVHGRRPFVKRKKPVAGLVETFSENIVVLPEIENLCFDLAVGNAGGIFGKLVGHCCCHQGKSLYDRK